MKPRTQAVLLLLATGLLWSMGGVFVKTSDMHPLAISSIRGGVAAIVFFIALRGRPKFSFSRPQIIGAAAYGVTLTCFVVATSLTSAANAILIQYTSPIYVAILAHFFLREKLRKVDFAAIGGVLIGMWLLVSNSLAINSPIGNIVALIGGVCFAICIISLRMQKDASPYETILLGDIFTFLIGAPWLILHPPSVIAALPIMFLGAFQIGVPYLLYTKASKHAKALDMSVLTVLEPALNPVWVFLVTGEFPGLRAVAGGAVLIGVVVMKAVIAEKD
ncbi:MAG: DMT family transporter [Clostridiales Family XIII bacterium]|nr:DMT family transporter [Clostridiales Family XIII bacterium]